MGVAARKLQTGSHPSIGFETPAIVPLLRALRTPGDPADPAQALLVENIRQKVMAWIHWNVRAHSIKHEKRGRE